MVPPPGVQPNFDNPETLHDPMLSTAIITTILLVTVVGVRIFTKAYIMRDMKLEDYITIVATAGVLSWNGIFIHISLNGFTRHLYDIRFVEVSYLSYVVYTSEISNAITMFVAKCSILFQLKSIFCPGQSRDANFWSIHILLFLNASYTIAAVFTFVFQCTPREKAWNGLMEGTCIDVAAATVVTGAVNLFLDLGILVVPLVAVSHLHLPTRSKLGVCAVFGVGIITCAIAAVGVVFRVPLLSNGDLTWIISKVGIWNMVEYFGTILVTCMPAFPRFLLFLRGKNANGQPSTSRSKSKTKPNTAPIHPSAKNGGTAASSDTGKWSQQQRHDGQRGVGLAVTTSDDSFTDPTYIELEHGYHRRATESRHSDMTAVSEGGRHGKDWSPLSSSP